MGWFTDIFEDTGIPNPGEDYIKGPERAAAISAEESQRAAEAAEALNRERYGEAAERLDPFMERERRAGEQMDIEMGLAPGEAGTAYMNTPGYQASLDETRRQVEQTAASGGGTAYGGRRLAEAGKAGAGVQQSYYNNYMNMLSNMSSPQVSQNLSSTGMGQGTTMGGQAIGAAGQAGQFRQQGANATQAATGDALGSLAMLFL